ncbi:hypothetical protein HZB03_02920, partial [Candidatus Woesearchaeota archaeon]|nr:hypothetical protein [Candidatus Woesearchaeota archaeon]
AARHAGVSFEIVQEATHHGPLLSKPSMFIEIGSDEKCWEDKTAGEIIAKTILYLITAEIKHCEAVFVLGGGHYNQVAQKVMRSTKYAVGHICPKYALPYLDAAMLGQLMGRSGSVPIAILDWKGLGQEKERIIRILEEAGVKYVRSDRLEY